MLRIDPALGLDIFGVLLSRRYRNSFLFRLGCTNPCDLYGLLVVDAFLMVSYSSLFASSPSNFQQKFGAKCRMPSSIGVPLFFPPPA